MSRNALKLGSKAERIAKKFLRERGIPYIFANGNEKSGFDFTSKRTRPIPRDRREIFQQDLAQILPLRRSMAEITKYGPRGIGFGFDGLARIDSTWNWLEVKANSSKFTRGQRIHTVMARSLGLDVYIARVNVATGQVQLDKAPLRTDGMSRKETAGCLLCLLPKNKSYTTSLSQFSSALSIGRGES
jgi:hypothetical protein